MKRFALAAVLMVLISSGTLFAQNDQVRSIDLNNVRCSNYPTVIKVKLFANESDVSPKWEGTMSVTSPQDSEVHFRLTDPAVLEAFSTESIGWYSLQCEGEAAFPAWKLQSVAYSAHSFDSSSLGGMPASAYALADSVNTAAFTANLNNEISRAQMIESNLALDLVSAQSSIQSETARALTAEAVLTNQLRTAATSLPVSKLELVGSPGSYPLFTATSRAVGDRSQFAEVFHIDNAATFSENNSIGTQTAAIMTDVPATNTTSVIGGILGANFLTTNEGTGDVRVITGIESDAVSSAGASSKVEGIEVSGTNDGATIGTLIGGAAKIWSTQVLGAAPGTTVDGIGLLVRSPQIDAGVIANVYGLQIEDQVGGANTNFAISTGLGHVKFGDKTLLAASTASASSLNIAAGSTPSAPLAGDLWNDGSNLFFRSNGVTKTLAFADGSPNTVDLSGMALASDLTSEINNRQQAIEAEAATRQNAIAALTQLVTDLQAQVAALRASAAMPSATAVSPSRLTQSAPVGAPITLTRTQRTAR